LFRKITPNIIKCEVLEAELIKLYTNSWRYIQFAISNELYMICERLGLNFNSIRKKIIYNYPRAKNMPTSGFAAGPCLYKDTIHLNNFYNNNFNLGKSAININHNLPNFIVKQLSKNLSLIKKTVGILGMAFKADIDDARNSLSIKLEKILKNNCSKVICSDEYIKNNKFVKKEELIDQSDIIIIGVPHKNYKNLNFKKKKVINIWGY
jgi:UDP-N-acetyl-D-mannosaminuronic acid dehydrogenase